MLKKLLPTVAALSISLSAVAECEKPVAPEVLDGASSDIEAFMARHGEVGAYVNDVQAFQDCLTAMEKEEMAAGTLTPERSQEILTEFNAASESAQSLGAAHNAQVRVMLQRDDYKEYSAAQK